MIKKIIFLLLLMINTSMVLACAGHQLPVQKSKNYSKLDNKTRNKLQMNIKPNNKESINK